MTLNLITSDDNKTNPRLLSPLTLAFVGDAVFDLMMREFFVEMANRPVSDLHSLSAKQVCAGAQARAAEKLRPLFTDEEEAIFRRGRNAHTSHTPKNSSENEYHLATALEALFGYLYLNGETDRLRELFAIISEEISSGVQPPRK